MMRYWLALALTVWCGFASALDHFCGVGAPCRVATGEYYLAFPDDWDGIKPLPAVLFFHGHRSTGENVIKSQELRSAFGARGYLIIAPNGALRAGANVRGWPARPAAGTRDDIAFVFEVLDDVERRLPLDRERILVTGFSSGGSMAWLLACYQGARFAAFAPVAGALRRPVPATKCPGGPVRMLHFHGFTDNQVPLEGRGIRDWHQGDVFESLGLLRATDQCRSNPTRFEMGEIYSCRIWEHCDSRHSIELCIHNGGHMLPKGWSTKALDWFEQGGT